MRYAIISDIHANVEALGRVLDEIDASGVDRVLCLGDVVGYHADPDACVDILRARADVVWLAGNHDRGAAGLIELVRFPERARRALVWTQAHMRTDNLQFLASLPVFRVEKGELCLVHGALHPRPNELLHLKTEKDMTATLGALRVGGYGVRLCFFGHTHRQVVYRGAGDQVSLVAQGPEAAARGALRLGDDAEHLVNPGSVGQPRDGDDRASFALWDGETRLLELRRLTYDVLRCRDKARLAGLVYKPSLARRVRDRLYEWGAVLSPRENHLR